MVIVLYNQKKVICVSTCKKFKGFLQEPSTSLLKNKQFWLPSLEIVHNQTMHSENNIISCMKMLPPVTEHSLSIL